MQKDSCIILTSQYNKNDTSVTMAMINVEKGVLFLTLTNFGSFKAQSELE